MPKITIKPETLASIIKAKEMISEAQNILENLSYDLRDQELSDAEDTIDNVVDELGTQWDALETLVTELQNEDTSDDDDMEEETEIYTVHMWDDGKDDIKHEEEICATSPEQAEELAADEYPGYDHYETQE